MSPRWVVKSSGVSNSSETPFQIKARLTLAGRKPSLQRINGSIRIGLFASTRAVERRSYVEDKQIIVGVDGDRIAVLRASAKSICGRGLRYNTTHKDGSENKLGYWRGLTSCATGTHLHPWSKRGYSIPSVAEFDDVRGFPNRTRYKGAQRLEAACKRANAMGMVGLRYLKSMLQHKLESDPLPDETHKVIPIHHANVRGQAT